MKPRPAGFTLLEVLVVLVVAGLVLVLLGQGVQAGRRATAALGRMRPPQLDITPVERSLRQMIERMDPGRYPDPPLIRGTAGALAFTTELPDPATGGRMVADVRLQASDGRLELWFTPHGGGVPLAGPPAPQRVVLLDRVAALELAYAAKGHGAGWQPAWSEPALPGLIRLHLMPAEGARSWPPIIVRPLREAEEE